MNEFTADGAAFIAVLLLLAALRIWAVVDEIKKKGGRNGGREKNVRKDHY